jgi:hypothetical protein
VHFVCNTSTHLEIQLLNQEQDASKLGSGPFGTKLIGIFYSIYYRMNFIVYYVRVQGSFQRKLTPPFQETSSLQDDGTVHKIAGTCLTICTSLSQLNPSTLLPFMIFCETHTKCPPPFAETRQRNLATC